MRSFFVDHDCLLHVQFADWAFGWSDVRITRVKVFVSIVLVDLACHDVNVIRDDVVGCRVCEVVDERRDVGGEERVDQGWEELDLSAVLFTMLRGQHTNMTGDLFSVS